MLEYLIFKTAVCVAGLFYFQKAINEFDFKIKTKFQTVFEMVNIFLLFCTTYLCEATSSGWPLQN